ncbi:MAG TPA: hypothetical protein VGK03_11085 [Geothrix sp.]
MLMAARNLLRGCQRTDGIEIDPLAHSEGLRRLNATGAIKSTYLLGSAFDVETLSKLAPEGYDLVITNPPYLRYQSQKSGAGKLARLPNAKEVRNGLRAAIQSLETLSQTDKVSFLSLVESYSGLSDLAVPSWILCAALVKEGGALAMVVPESWLNRDYALIIRYMLLRWFRIEFIVEDAHSTWFPEVQIKTTLLVARRIPKLDSIADFSNATYLHVSLPSSLSNGKSLVGGGELATSKNPEREFARKARAVLHGQSDELMAAVKWDRVRLADQADAVMQKASGKKWLALFEPKIESDKIAKIVVPTVLKDWFDEFVEFESLADLGMEVGQGLRTGANDFFYADIIQSAGGVAQIRLSKLFNNASITLPMACVRSVIRRQAEVPGIVVAPNELQGVVLAFQDWALPEHAEASCGRPLPEQIAQHINHAAQMKVGEVYLPMLSAVSPNTRRANPRTGTPARFWYMLPRFAPRHSPDMLVPRVNGDTPRVTLNPHRQTLVDANFSTLWLKEGARVTVHMMLAFLNSTLARALYECSGTVMGGGALKLEATHLRFLPVPILPKTTWTQIGALGVKLEVEGSEKQNIIIREIDQLLLNGLFSANMIETKLNSLRAIIQEKKSNRESKSDTSPRA